MGSTEAQRERSRPGIGLKVAFYNLYFFGEAGPQGEENCLIIGWLGQTHLLKDTFLGDIGKALPGGWEMVGTLPPELLAPNLRS